MGTFLLSSDSVETWRKYQIPGWCTHQVWPALHQVSILFQNAGATGCPLCSARGPSGTERSLPWGKDSPATTPALDLPWLWEEGAGPWPPAASWKELTALLSWSRNSALWVWLGIKCFSHPEGLFEFIKTPQFCSGANVRLLQVFFQNWTGHHSWSILQSPKLSSSFCLRPACKFWTLFSHPQSRKLNCSVSHLVTEHRRARTYFAYSKDFSPGLLCSRWVLCYLGGSWSFRGTPLKALLPLWWSQGPHCPAAGCTGGAGTLEWVLSWCVGLSLVPEEFWWQLAGLVGPGTSLHCHGVRASHQIALTPWLLWITHFDLCLRSRHKSPMCADSCHCPTETLSLVLYSPRTLYFIPKPAHRPGDNLILGVSIKKALCLQVDLTWNKGCAWHWQAQAEQALVAAILHDPSRRVQCSWGNTLSIARRTVHLYFVLNYRHSGS